MGHLGVGRIRILGGGFILLLIIALVAGTCGAVSAADSFATLKVGIYDNEPKIFTDEDGNPAGFWPDLIEYIASQEGWTIEYVHGNWSECLARLENGEIDMMPDVAYSEERAKKYDFSHEPVYCSWSRVYTRPGAGINSILDLQNRNIAVLKGAINVEGPEGIKRLIRAFDIGCSFIEVDSYIKVFELVAAGEADAAVVSKDFGWRHEADYGLAPTPIIFQPSLLYFAFPKGSSLAPYLIERIDYHIVALKEDDDSVYYDSLYKWLRAKPARKAVIPGWLIWTLAGIGGLALLLLGFTFVLRSQVRARTKELSQEVEKHKRAQEQLANYRLHLEQMVEARTEELREKNLELEQAKARLEEMDRLKSIFLASMSHELRTPLNSIIGFTGIMLQGMAGELNEEQKKQLGIVKSSASHLLNLINDVLDISRIEAGRVELSPEEFNLGDVVKDVMGASTGMAGEKGLELVSDVPGDIVLYSDKRRMKQILMNLVSNAIKFTERGSVRVGARVLDGGKVEISVCDTGMGIKEEEMPRLFQPFQQVGASLTRRHEGTGLGLYLTKKLCELLGGSIEVKSRYGSGSEFTITVPVRYAAV